MDDFDELFDEELDDEDGLYDADFDDFLIEKGILSEDGTVLREVSVQEMRRLEVEYENTR